ncbi:hypothetical protein ACIBEA_37035 [Streptomyces sp. NPDC051555]|uniref:hypothetical protein n=1 Tax=Streptomyces sp. NPDC051555 TaxID=3365657 RepID=UPI003797F7A5
MSFEQEWSSARAAVRLNHVPGSPGGPADLRIANDDLGAVGSDAYALHERLSRDGDHARAATFEASIALTNHNFTSGAALLKVHDRWSSQLKVLVAACANISNHLDYTVASHDKEEADLVATLSASKVSELLK